MLQLRGRCRSVNKRDNIVLISRHCFSLVAGDERAKLHRAAGKADSDCHPNPRLAVALIGFYHIRFSHFRVGMEGNVKGRLERGQRNLFPQNLLNQISSAPNMSVAA